jgi:hypothetical protein
MSDRGRRHEIDIDELTRRSFFGASDEGSPAKARALERLRASFEAELPALTEPRRRRWFRPALMAAAVAIVATAVAVTIVLPPGQGGPKVSAAQELERLADVARAQPVSHVAPGEFLYSAFDEHLAHGEVHLTSGRSFTYVERASEQTWLGADGSGFRVTLVQSVSFPSDADRASWEALGSPPLPEVGQTITEHYKPGALPFYDLSDLPTDLAKLEPLIRGQSVIEHGHGDDLVFYAIGSLLEQGGGPAGVRAALFEVAARLPDVRSLGTVTDPLGRQGLGIEVMHAGAATRLIFDPATSQVLAEQRTQPLGEGNVPISIWRAFTEAAVVSHTGSTEPS